MIAELTAKITEIGYSAQMLLAAALAAALLSGFRLWRITQREGVQRRRLEAFRGAPIGTQIRSLPWYRRLGIQIAASPIVGTVEQQRLLKLLAAAGIKGRGSLANFVASKVCGAIVLAGLVWLLSEWQQLLPV